MRLSIGVRKLKLLYANDFDFGFASIVWMRMRGRIFRHHEDRIGLSLSSVVVVSGPSVGHGDSGLLRAPLSFPFDVSDIRAPFGVQES